MQRRPATAGSTPGARTIRTEALQRRTEMSKPHIIQHCLSGSLMVLMAAALLSAHGNATHLIGTVTAIDGDHATIRLQNGKSENVMFNNATKYLNGSNKAATKADMKI